MDGCLACRRRPYCVEWNRRILYFAHYRQDFLGVFQRDKTRKSKIWQNF